jgi:hypothetical protein
MTLEPILALALVACRAVKGGDLICYSWIQESFKLWGVGPWHLKQLAQLGLLVRVDGSRGRAYYRLAPAAAAFASPVLA